MPPKRGRLNRRKRGRAGHRSPVASSTEASEEGSEADESDGAEGANKGAKRASAATPRASTPLTQQDGAKQPLPEAALRKAQKKLRQAEKLAEKRPAKLNGDEQAKVQSIPELRQEVTRLEEEMQRHEQLRQELLQDQGPRMDVCRR